MMPKPLPLSLPAEPGREVRCHRAVPASRWALAAVRAQARATRPADAQADFLRRLREAGL